jgi:capsular exopolysaccharide synthesis family protein
MNPLQPSPPQDLLVVSRPYPTINVPPPEKELTIKDLLRVTGRRRSVVLGTIMLFVGAATLLCVFSTRRYLATAEIQVQKESGTQLGLDAPDASDTSFSDALQGNITLQTQVGILGSDSLALKVIHDLNLTSTSDFQAKFNPISWVLEIVSPKGPSDAQFGPPDQVDLGLSPRDRINVLKVFAKNLKVKPVAGTRLIDIEYLSPSPRLAADIVNHLVQGLSDYNFETRHAATAHIADYLSAQLADLRKQSEDMQAQLAHAQRESGVLSLGGVDAMGREQVYSSVLDKLQQATTSYTQAQSNRIAKDAIYQAAKTGDPEAISSLSGSAALTSSGTTNALSLIQSLRMQQDTLKAQLAQASAKFGPAYPKLDEMQQQLDALNGSIATEVARLADRAKNDADVATAVENNARKVYLDLKLQADALGDKTMAYTILRQEADQSRTLYETLFKQLKQAGVLADFKVSSISVVDPARVPAKPARPNVPLYLAISVAAGLLFGLCGALLRDNLDNKIGGLSELEAQLGEVPLGVLPFHSKSRRHHHAALTPATAPSVRKYGAALLAQHEKSDLLSLSDPWSAYVEGIRALRTSLLLSRSGSPPQVILVTSSVAGEGKTMLSVNLAAQLAQQGKQVLLVDGDLRRPTLHRKLNLPNDEGLSAFLAGARKVQDPLDLGMVSREMPNLTVLTAGVPPPYPAELLDSERMRQAVESWREHYDFIVIDAAPVLPVTDSVVLSTMVDFTLLLARHDITERQSLDRSYRMLQTQLERSKIGIVLNAVRRDSGAYYQYYGYKDSVYNERQRNA